MPLRLLESDRVRSLVDCPKCGAGVGRQCDSATLSPGAENHAARLKAARWAQYEKETRRRR